MCKFFNQVEYCPIQGACKYVKASSFAKISGIATGFYYASAKDFKYPVLCKMILDNKKKILFQLQVIFPERHIQFV